MPSVTLKNDRHLPFAWATDFFQRISTMRRFTTSADPFSLMNTLGPNLPVSLKKKFSQCLGPLSIRKDWGKVSFPAIRLKSSGILPANEVNGSLAYTALPPPLSPPPPPPLHCNRFPQQKSEIMKWIGVWLIPQGWDISPLVPFPLPLPLHCDRFPVSHNKSVQYEASGSFSYPLSTGY